MFRTHYEDTFGFWYRRKIVRKISMKHVWSRVLRLAECTTEDDYLPF